MTRNCPICRRAFSRRLSSYAAEIHGKKAVDCCSFACYEIARHRWMTQAESTTTNAAGITVAVAKRGA